MSAKVNYGSVEDQTDGFDEKDMYYVKDNTTREQKMRKLFLIAVPILAAILIIGGAALFLFKDFDNLYPGKGGGNKEPMPSTKHHITVSSTKAAPAPSPATSDSESAGGSGGAKDCSANEKCKELELIGNCCPTSEGIFLGCCN